MHKGWQSWLLSLGKLLPSRMREVVFEPACYDLVRETLKQQRSSRLLAPRLVGILVHVALANFPGVLIDNRRPSRLALMISGLMLLMLLTLILVVIAMRGSYGP